MNRSITVTVNGVRQQREVEPRLLLTHFLRDTLGLTGTHIGCDTSQCGACTVALDGEIVKSCTVFAVQADGARVLTVEGLAQDERLHPVQTGFWEEHGLQCGFCTPGMIMAVWGLLKPTPTPARRRSGTGIDGNLCPLHRLRAHRQRRAARRAQPPPEDYGVEGDTSRAGGAGGGAPYGLEQPAGLTAHRGARRAAGGPRGGLRRWP